ncbi:MAG: cell division protein SepF [Arthrobacter sp.]|uniref:cell division protein SepF n=1 Tax=Arthrobacter sp. TaxID=1667 RepID=UPI00347F32B2
MAGALRKTMIYLGLADGDERYGSEDYDLDERDDVRRHEPAMDDRGHHAVAAAPEADTEYRAPVTPIKRAPSSRDEDSSLRQITTVHPRSYNDAKIIGESFREGIPVIMNVTDMGEGDAKRLVDFSAGLVFGLHGSIERVTNKVFLLSPSTVEVLGEDKKSSEGQASFFNQS